MNEMIQKFNYAIQYSTHIQTEVEEFWKFRGYLDKQVELNVITNKRNTEKSLNAPKYAHYESLNAEILCWAIQYVFAFSFLSQ